MDHMEVVKQRTHLTVRRCSPTADVNGNKFALVGKCFGPLGTELLLYEECVFQFEEFSMLYWSVDMYNGYSRSIPECLSVSCMMSQSGPQGRN